MSAKTSNGIRDIVGKRDESEQLGVGSVGEMNVAMNREQLSGWTGPYQCHWLIQPDVLRTNINRVNSWESFQHGVSSKSELITI